MLKKFILFALATLLIQVVNVSPVFAKTLAKKEPPSVEKVKKSIDKLGVGEKSRATIKLKDGTKLKGYIYSAGENDFVIVDRKTGQKTTIAYTDVVGIEGKNLSTGAKIAIGAGIGAAAILVVMGIAIASALSSFTIF